MKVTFVNRFFPPDISATSQLLGELVEDLLRMGVNIRVITSNSSYLGGRLSDTDVYNSENLKIIRISSTSFGRKNILSRYIDFFSFLLLGSARLFMDDSDITVLFTDPPMISNIGAMNSLIKGKKYIIVLQDFFPYTAERVGFLKNRLLFSILHKNTSYVLKKAGAIVSLSENMADFICSLGVPGDRVRVIHNWADGERIFPIKKEESKFYNSSDLQNKFVVLYSGNMGVPHEFSTIIDVAERVQKLGIDNIIFLFVGDGVKRQEVERVVREREINNVRFLNYFPKEDLRDSLALADVHLITQIESVVGVNMPSKLYGCMASGRPIIYIGSMKSDVARIIREADCGFPFGVGDVNGVYNAILKLMNDRDLTKNLGENARKYFIDNYDRKIAANKYYNLLIEVYES